MDTVDALRLIGIYKLSASGREDDAIQRLRDLILDSIEDRRFGVLGGLDLSCLSPPILFWLVLFLPTVGLQEDTLYLRVRARVLGLCCRRWAALPFAWGPAPGPLGLG